MAVEENLVRQWKQLGSALAVLIMCHVLVLEVSVVRNILLMLACHWARVF